MALGFLNGGGGNSHSVQTPAGVVVEGETGAAYKKWQALPQEERRKFLPPSLDPPRLPEGGLAVRVFMRALKRNAAGGLEVITDQDIKSDLQHYPSWITDPSERRFPARLYAEPMGDILWLTREELQSLVPADPKPGASFAVPAPVARRIIRMHLKNGTQGWLGYWELKHIRSEAMTLQVESASPAIRMRLEGSVLVADDPDVSASKGGYDAKLSGRLEYDPAKKAFTRFDLLALGEHWGPRGKFTRPGRNPLGIAFELAKGDHPMDQAYPFALYFPGQKAYFQAEGR